MADRTGVSRRKFLETAAIGAGGVALRRHAAMAEQLTAPALPDPEQSGIDHVVVVMMENRSFDHISGVAARGRRAAGGADVLRSRGAGARHSSARPGLSGLWTSGSRPLLCRRSAV